MSSHRARLLNKVNLTDEIAEFRFQVLDGPLEGLEPGAHVDIGLAPGMVRQYSLCTWDSEGRWFNIAVKQEPDGRGGSTAMHGLAIGDEVELGGPRNHFALAETSKHITLITGGIGVTPILPMVRELQCRGADFRVFYVVRSRELAAMDSQFREMSLGDHYHLHCSDSDGRFDIAAVIQTVPVGGDVYVCGPEPMLEEVLNAGSDLRGGAIHFERFAAAATFATEENDSFEIELQSSGKVLEVGPQESILDVLRAHDVPVEFGCYEGLCGSCMVDVVAGEVDHRDGVLSPAEQEANEFLCVCVSRARSRRLVLQL
ncbi:PDR/VanB family oxidoreductase [Fodinicurvata fenggangensis]|uniref:PDR/VanB family oxidoreductase n=1 Tax=Fodinicurvata fenggangensis TaxID=1121830 RepID=UPI00047CE80B|nr:PDR/VanB family oxidoreductase [Fodinicurvata fenggangensis]